VCRVALYDALAYVHYMRKHRGTERRENHYRHYGVLTGHVTCLTVTAGCRLQ